MTLSLYAPPARLYAGDSWAWEIPDPASHPSAAHVLSYALGPEAGGAVIEITAEAPSPIAVAFRRTAVATAALRPGRWRWTLLASDPVLEIRGVVATGTFEVLANPMAATGDQRTSARRILEAIEATIEGRVVKDAAQYMIEGRSITRTPLPDLLKARDLYRRMVRREEGRGPIEFRKVRFRDE